MSLTTTNWLETKTLDIEQILKVLPHRYPFLLVDRVLEFRPGKPVRLGMSKEELLDTRKGSFAHAIKNITYNEMQFLGHFPGKPVFPGVLTLEAMAQAAVFTTVPFLAANNQGALPSNLTVALAGVDEVRFRKLIVPGDQMHIKMTVSSVRATIWGFEASVEVDGKLAAEGKFLAHMEAK